MSDTYEITETFEEPFYTGSAAAALPEKTGYDVALDGRGYMIDWTAQIPYSRRSVALLNTQQAQSGGDQSQTPPEIWRRSIESWHQGNGQARLDRDDSLPYRFSVSEGVDVWTPWQVSLLHSVTIAQTLDDGFSRTLTIDGYVVVIVGDTGYWYDTSAQTWTEVDFGDDVVDAASDGSTIYLLLDDGTVDTYTAPAVTATLVSSAVSDFSTTRSMIAVIKGFLVIGNLNILYDATSGTPAEIYTHPNAGWNWKAGCDGQNVGYLIGGTGDRWHVFGVPLKDDATTLDPPTIATTLPDGEIPTTLASYLGYVLIGSQRGFRLAQADGSGALTYGRLVVTDAPVECFEGQDRFVWFGRSVPDSKAGLGRADLSTFTSPLTPAVANDLSQADGGRVGGCATVGDRRLFVVDGVGVFLEDLTGYVDSGYIEMGGLTFGSTDLKQGTYAQVFYEKITNGGTIYLDYRADGGTWETIGQSVSGVTMGNVPLTKSFTTVEIRVRLEPDTVDGTHTPVLNRTEVRALVIPGRASEWTIPLIVADVLQYEGATEPRDIISDFDHLLGLAQSRKPFILREGIRNVGVFATDYYWFPMKESEGMRSHEGTFVLTLKEIA
jgi:hypothetical protein